MKKRRTLPVVAASACLALVAFLAVFGPWISPHDPNVGKLIDALQNPTSQYWLGTDYLGRDLLSRIIAGSRVAMIAGVEATTVALVLGVSVGMVIGLVGGWTDRIAMRAIDGMSAIPAIVLAIAIIAALGSGLTRSMFAVGVAFAMSMARLVRGLTLAERERLYVDGARVVGANRRRLLVRHIGPNIAGPIAIQATLVFASAIAIEAALSFLGLGTQPPQASWGGMLSSAQRTVRQAPFQAIPPGLAIAVTVLSVNILGDALVLKRRGESYSNPSGYLEPVAVSASVGDNFGPEETSTDDILFRARDVHVDYGPLRAVNGVNLDIRRGEVVALVGESGSGKTSLAMAISGLLTSPAEVRAATMSIQVAGSKQELVGATPKQRHGWRTQIGVVFQEPSASLNPLQTVGRQLSDVIKAQRGRDRTDIRVRVAELLTAVGLPEPAEVARLRPSQISGGMAQRVMIALALAKEPALLVADEPTTALDVTVQAEVIKLLKRLCEERHFAVLLVTHDLGVAGELSDRCLVMYRGQLVEAGPTRELARSPKHPYTSALVTAVPQNEPGRPILHRPDSVGGREAGDPLAAEIVTDEGCNYRLACPHVQPICSIPMIDELVANFELRDNTKDTSRRVKCHRYAELQLPGARTSSERTGAKS